MRWTWDYCLCVVVSTDAKCYFTHKHFSYPWRSVALQIVSCAHVFRYQSLIVPIHPLQEKYPHLRFVWTDPLWPRTGSDKQRKTQLLIDLLEVSIRTHLAGVKIYVYHVPYDPHQTENTSTNDSGMYANTHTRALRRGELNCFSKPGSSSWVVF